MYSCTSGDSLVTDQPTCIFYVFQNNAQVQLANVSYLIINLEDENDNAPQFTLDPYPASVPEDSPIGTSVIQVKAEDIDSRGPNSRVSSYLVLSLLK